MWEDKETTAPDPSVHQMGSSRPRLHAQTV